MTHQVPIDNDTRSWINGNFPRTTSMEDWIEMIMNFMFLFIIVGVISTGVLSLVVMTLTKTHTPPDWVLLAGLLTFPVGSAALMAGLVGAGAWARRRKRLGITPTAWPRVRAVTAVLQGWHAATMRAARWLVSKVFTMAICVFLVGVLGSIAGAFASSAWGRLNGSPTPDTWVFGGVMLVAQALGLLWWVPAMRDDPADMPTE